MKLPQGGKSELTFVGSLFLLGALVFWDTWHTELPMLNLTISPRVFPYVIAVSLMVLSAILFIAVLRGDVAVPEGAEAGAPVEKTDFKTFGIVLASLLAYLLLVDRAGFIVNALLFPYLNNAIAMFAAGTATMEDIDVAMKGGCNFPMGPFALLDLVGLDTSVAILNALHAEFKSANLEPRPMLKKLVSEGKLGRKTKQGFYSY